MIRHGRAPLQRHYHRSYSFLVSAQPGDMVIVANVRGDGYILNVGSSVYLAFADGRRRMYTMTG